MRYRWNYQAPTHNEVEAANSFAKELGIHPILCHLLQKRGITTVRRASQPGDGKKGACDDLWRL